MKTIAMCKSIAGRSAVAYGCKHFNITNGTCSCKNNCEHKFTVTKKDQNETNL